MIKRNLVFFILLLISSISFAQTSEEQEYIKKAQEKLKATFSQLTVVDFKPTPVPDLFEINMGQATIYFHAKQELLFFGEIYNKEGVNLTQQSRQNAVQALMKGLPMESALILGDPDGIPIIEFTDPDCPYCRRYETWLSTISDAHKIKRIIFFDNRIHPAAAAKIEHILCSENKEKAFYEIYRNIVPAVLQSCDSAQQVLSDHIKIAKSLGVSGTPSFILDGKMSVGFRKKPIEDYLNSYQEPQT